jgi:hypothetical protein
MLLDRNVKVDVLNRHKQVCAYVGVENTFVIFVLSGIEQNWLFYSDSCCIVLLFGSPDTVNVGCDAWKDWLHGKAYSGWS